jgi:hypothetical protein
MRSEFKSAAFWTTILFVVAWLIIPSLENKFFGKSVLLRFDPKFSKDYDCIFVEAYSQRSFAVPWLKRSTPIKYLRLRYTPLGEQQPYGIAFVDPKTLAFEAHPGFAQNPGQLSGKLNTSAIFDWMQSQPQSIKTDSHVTDAQNIYDAVIALAPNDLEHFTLLDKTSFSNFQIGHTSKLHHDLPVWPSLLALIGIWSNAYNRWNQNRKKYILINRNA